MNSTISLDSIALILFKHWIDALTSVCLFTLKGNRRNISLNETLAYLHTSGNPFSNKRKRILCCWIWCIKENLNDIAITSIYSNKLFLFMDINVKLNSPEPGTGRPLQRLGKWGRKQKSLLSAKLCLEICHNYVSSPSVCSDAWIHQHPSTGQQPAEKRRWICVTHFSLQHPQRTVLHRNCFTITINWIMPKLY